MSQATFGDEDLFGEAASEMREDVEESLAATREALPDAAAVWDVSADNTLGVLNALRSGLDVGEAEAHLRDAKKWYTMGERADAFDDAEDLAAEIESIESLLEDLADAREQVGELTATIPQVRGALEDLDADAAADGGDADDAEPSEDDVATEDADAAAEDADAEAEA